LTWTANSSEIVYSGQREGSGSSLWRIPVTGGAPKRLALPTASAANPNISARSGHLVFTQASTDTNIYRSDGPGFAGAPAPGRFGAERGLILSSRLDDSPNFSADGQWIAFVSNRSGYPAVWIARKDGGHETQLTSLTEFNVGTPRWSPDGRWIAFDGATAGHTQIYVIGADGGSLRRLTTEPAADVMPSWSPDGKWIYFTSTRSGPMELWKEPSAGGPAIQLTRGGARESWPSPDGKLLYYTKSQPEGDIWTVPVEGGPEQPAPELAGFKRIAREWGVIPEGIYFISQEDTPRQEVRFFSFATRRVTPLATLGRELIGNLPELALSPDGRSLLTVHLDHEVEDLMLVENFHSFALYSRSNQC
jgi:Tol biopolymer transport system component